MVGPVESNFLKERRRSAIEIVRRELEKDGLFQLVSTEGDKSTIWRTKIPALGKDWTVDIDLSGRFPDEIPTARVHDYEPLFLRNPHVLKGGTICTVPDSAAINSNDPVGIVRYVCDQAKEILNGISTEDFKDEFSYYWNRCAEEDAQDVLILDPIEELGEAFPVIFRKGIILAASSEEALNKWSINFAGKQFESETEDIGVVVNLASALLPKDYPNTLSDLMALADANDPTASGIIKSYIVASRGNCLALLIQKEGDGAALGGVIFDGLGLGESRSSNLIKGFRPGNVPDPLLLSRADQKIRSTKVIRSVVKRIDHHRIHSRGGDGRDFSKKRVLLIGCGSLGGYVAHLLSRAGVGHITITDNDRLAWENLGRHILGASSVGKWKAEALAEELTQQLPHLEIKGIPKDWRDVFQTNPKIFDEHDLIVSTVADWRCEGPLNAMARSAKMPPILFGWLEPHAVAGHCLAVSGSGGCFECSVNEFGQFQYSVANFEGVTISKEPGGCAHYQHYGPTALMPVASMIASVAIESLLSSPEVSQLKTWVSNKEHFVLVKASVTESWKKNISEDGFSRTYQTIWDKSKTCPLCVRPV